MNCPTVISLAAEIAGLLNRHSQASKNAQDEQASRDRSSRQGVGRVTQLLFHLERILLNTEDNMVSDGLTKQYRRLRILKDQVKECLTGLGYTWDDPTGKEFTTKIAGQVDVDGWRHSDEYTEEIIVEVREPVIFFEDRIILNGAVIVGAPND